MSETFYGFSSEIKVMAIVIEKTTILEVKATIALPFWSRLTMLVL